MNSLFEVGDIVKISSLGREGVVLALLENGRYKVSLGNLAIELTGSDLTKVKQRNKRAKSSSSSKGAVTVSSSVSQLTEAEEIDLHGYTVVQAIAALEDKINRAIIAKQYRVRVVHGIGSGKLKEAIRRFLSETDVVSSFKADDFNPGVTWIYL